MLKKAKLLRPAPPGSKQLAVLESTYSDCLESNAKERKTWTASDKAILAGALIKLKQALNLSNEDLKVHTPNNGNSPQNVSTTGKIIRAVMSIALRIGNKTVSHFLRNKLEKQGGWDELFNDKEWFKYLRLGGSFGNVSNLKGNQGSHWGLRLKAWAEAYLEKHEEVSLEEVFVFCNMPSNEEKEGLKAGRMAFKAYLNEKAKSEKYPDMQHLMRNIYRACDPRVGVGFRSLNEHDYAIAVRCCKIKGICAAGFALAREKTGLACAQIYDMCIDVRHRFGGLAVFRQRVEACDLKEPEPYIARLAAEEEDEEEGGDSSDDGDEEEATEGEMAGEDGEDDEIEEEEDEDEE